MQFYRHNGFVLFKHANYTTLARQQRLALTIQHHAMQQDADERPRAAEKEGDEGVEETEQEIPQPLEHLPTAKKSVAAAPIDGMFTRDEEYRRNHCVLV